MESTKLTQDFNKKSYFSSFGKTLFVLVLIMIAMAAPIFAEDTIGQLDTWANKILSLFQSSWVKAILLVALIVEAIAMVVAGRNGGGGEMLKRFAPWIIGTIVLLSASGITTYFVGDLKFTTN